MTLVMTVNKIMQMLLPFYSLTL